MNQDASNILNDEFEISSENGHYTEGRVNGKVYPAASMLLIVGCRRIEFGGPYINLDKRMIAE